MFDFEADLPEDFFEPHDHTTVTGESAGDVSSSGAFITYQHCELGHVIGKHVDWLW